MRTASIIAPAAGAGLVFCLASSLAAVDTESRHLRGIIDIGFDSPKVYDGVPFDTYITAELAFQERLSSNVDAIGPALLTGFGIAGHYETGKEAGIYEYTYTGVTLRYYLGLSYFFTHAWELRVLPYVGIGGAQLDATVPALGLDTAAVAFMNEWGLQTTAAFYMNDLELCLGLSYNGRHSTHTFDLTPYDASTSWMQGYLGIDVGIGWAF